jgi:hypothetical protein
MSGQHEQRDGLERSSQPEQLDATLIMARPAAPGSGGYPSERPAPAGKQNSRSVFDPIPAADRRQGALDSAAAADGASGAPRNGASGHATWSAPPGAAEEDRVPAEADRIPSAANRTPAEADPAPAVLDPEPAADMRPLRNGVPRSDEASDRAVEQPAAVHVLSPTAEPALVREVPDSRWTSSAVNGSAGRGPGRSEAGSASRQADQPARHVDTPARHVDQPLEPGTWADLRQRLERLPYGHPSSPYHVDGERKPPPPRLVHLELAPPAPDRIGERPSRSSPQASHQVDPAPADDHREPARAEVPPTRARAASAQQSRGRRARQSPPAPAQPIPFGPDATVSPPESAPTTNFSEPAASAGAAGNGPDRSGEWPAPRREPDRPPATAQAGAAATGQKDSPLPAPPQPTAERRIPPEAEPGSTPVAENLIGAPAEPPPRFTQPSTGRERHASHPSFTPTAEPIQHPVDRSTGSSVTDGEPATQRTSRRPTFTPASQIAGSDARSELSGIPNDAPAASARRGPGFNPDVSPPRMGSDGSWTWGPAKLAPDQVGVADDAYDRFRAAEGRDLFGSYVGSGLTAKLRQIEERLEHGSLDSQTEDHALLDIDVFRARFAEMLRRHPDRSPELLATRVPGALSYAFIFGLDDYADGIVLVQDALEAQGFELQARKNSWSSAANRCVFTMWSDPLSELPFEVQFHTSASFEAQQLARTSVNMINDPRIPPEEAASLRSDLASAWAAVPSPPGNAEIGDYRRYGSAPRR